MPQQTDELELQTDRDEQVSEPEELTADTLIEDVSIDGMCGVY